MKVLLVDDSKTIRMILRNLLWELGIDHVTEAADGLEALEALASERFDLVLMDLHMPERSGMSVLEEMKAEGSAHKDTPVVIVSSDSDYHSIERARDLGALGYIKKPFKKEALRTAIGVAAGNLEEPV